MKTFIKFIIVLLCSLIIAIIAFFIWYSDTGRENQYYIKEANMYIKTYPSRETVIIAFSDNIIGDFSDSLDYVKVYKGDNYYTDFFFDAMDKTIYSRNNSIINSHLMGYELKIVAFRDTAYYTYRGNGSYLLKSPYTGVSMSFWGSKEKVSVKNQNEICYTEIKTIGSVSD
ncbi:hypothetical protein [uncultured Dysgonomonas sp.]|uniref:Uncharacterized protein n=1 Tax=uncultured Dysgonomonas sp. TaxID=206096 RepID=A0A212JNW8_9BACT|nr:hypothetical protein [uncultured Dysgonomonas sp.]SBW01090.1 hypothetical protein KL86DYS1_20366 [uncultured Dysgonomonas sp.]